MQPGDVPAQAEVAFGGAGGHQSPRTVAKVLSVAGADRDDGDIALGAVVVQQLEIEIHFQTRLSSVLDRIEKLQVFPVVGLPREAPLETEMLVERHHRLTGHRAVASVERAPVEPMAGEVVLQCGDEIGTLARLDRVGRRREREGDQQAQGEYPHDEAVGSHVDVTSGHAHPVPVSRLRWRVPVPPPHQSCHPSREKRRNLLHVRP